MSEPNWQKLSYTELKTYAHRSEATSLPLWRKYHYESYRAARLKGIHIKISKSLKWRKTTERSKDLFDLTTVELKQLAFESGANSLKEWNLKHPASYLEATERGIGRLIADDLRWQVKDECIDWSSQNNERLKQYAYDSGANGLKQWSQLHSGSYVEARKRDCQRWVAKELGWKVMAVNVNWSDYSNDDIKAFAEESGAKTLSQWSQKHGPSHAEALRRKIQRTIAESLSWEVRPEAEKSLRGVSYKQLLKFAVDSSAKSIDEWREMHNRSYKEASRRKILKQISEDLEWSEIKNAKRAKSTLSSDVTDYKNKSINNERNNDHVS